MASEPHHGELNGEELLKNSSLYREFLAERGEILRHKWIESEKLGRDIGFEAALTDWILHHRSDWRHFRKKSHPKDSRNEAESLPELFAPLTPSISSCKVSPNLRDLDL